MFVYYIPSKELKASMIGNHLVNPWREKNGQISSFTVLLHRSPQDLVVLFICHTIRDSGHGGMGWFLAAACVVTLCPVWNSLNTMRDTCHTGLGTSTFCKKQVRRSEKLPLFPPPYKHLISSRQSFFGHCPWLTCPHKGSIWRIKRR